LLTVWSPGVRGIHGFTSVREALKCFGSNVDGIFLGGLGVDPEPDPELGDFVPSVGAGVEGAATEVGAVGVCVPSSPLHEARAPRHTPPAIAADTSRIPRMPRCYPMEHERKLKTMAVGRGDLNPEPADHESV
jgi:hypothetical protein